MGKDQTTKTWKELVGFIQDIDSRSGGSPNPQTYKVLANQALMIISELTDIGMTSWTNASGGGLTLSGNSFLIPATCLSPISVEWDGVPLERMEIIEMGLELAENWRTMTGPTPCAFAVEHPYIVLDLAPTGVTTGKLTMRGKGMLPEFSDDIADTNPLSLIPARWQLAPAYYVLSMLPADPTKAPDIARKQEYTAIWSTELKQMVVSLRRRTYERFEY